MKSWWLTEPEQCSLCCVHSTPWATGSALLGGDSQHMDRIMHRGNMNCSLREEWEPFPPLSGSSNEIQRAGTMPEHAMRAEWQTNTGKCLSQQWQSQGKSSTRCSFTEIPSKRPLITEELLPRHRSLLMLCSWIQWAAQAALSDLWSQCLSLRRHREITLYPSQAPTRNLTAAPASQSPTGKNTQPTSS